ncbi:MAG: molybdate ABC transporter substrate-binding protein [Candidatus Eisenbacteria bacterium]|nr:molybdate ABC transporter substrate-binding protein [Candidatus Eisenbacteria bacterium]
MKPVIALLLITLMAFGCQRPDKSPERPLLVMGAASLTEVLPKVGAAWAEQGHPLPGFTFDASSRLARQIEAGAPADLFVAADTAWMNDLARKGLVAEPTRVDLLGNRLVVVVPESSRRSITNLADIAHPAYRRLALAGEAVPAGRYARSALESAGVLNTVRDRIINGDNVRVALAWVAGGDADAAIVYATDARIEPRIRVALEIPAGLSPEIIYPAGVIARSTARKEAEDFLRFCRGNEARTLFEAAGFRHAASFRDAEHFPHRGATGS